MTSWLRFPAEHSTPIPLYTEDMLEIFSWFFPSFIFFNLYMCVCVYVYKSLVYKHIGSVCTHNTVEQ